MLDRYAAKRLVNHDLAVRKCKSFAFGSGRKKQGAHACSHAYTNRGYIRLDELHRIIDSHAGCNGTARRVNIQVNIFLRILCRQEQATGQ